MVYILFSIFATMKGCSRRRACHLKTVTMVVDPDVSRQHETLVEVNGSCSGMKEATYIKGAHLYLIFSFACSKTKWLKYPSLLHPFLF